MQHDRNTESAPDRSRSAPPDRDALAQIAEILERLTMPSENRVYIPSHAQFLVTHAALYAVQDTPRARDGGTKKTREELKILVKRAVALRNHILSMHRDTLAAIRDQPDHDDPPVIARDVWNLAIAADRAYGKLQGAMEKPAGPKGRRHRAAAVTERAASTFEQLTGYRATVSVDPHSHRSYGTFLELLADVFRVLGIRASPEAQVRAFLKEKRHRKNGA